MDAAPITKAISLALLLALGCSKEPKLNELGQPYNRWLDRPEQVRLRGERPQRKYPRYQKIYKWPPGRDADKTTLFGFLGCRFGEKTSGWPPERYVRLDKPFFGFRWIRHDAYPGCCEIVRCDARMTFVSDEKSTVPIRRIKALRDEFKAKYGAEFWDETESESDYHAMTQVDGEYRLELFFQAKESGRFRRRPTVYEIGFEIVNERLLPDDDHRTVEQPVANWHGVLHETHVSAADAENEEAWTYDVGSGKTLEEILQDWVRDRDVNLLKVGKSEIGKWDWRERDKYVVACPEWDADDYCARLGMFVKHVDLKAVTRIQDMRAHPELFAEEPRTKNGDYEVGRIYCELIPGDRVLWHGQNWQKKGVVCGEGEDGEWWDCIGRKMKSVTTFVYPEYGSVKPTETDRACVRKMANLRRKKWEVRSCVCAQLGHEIDFSTNGVAAVTNFLQECLSEQRSGLYVGVHERKWLCWSVKTEELAQKMTKRREQDRINDYQYDLDCFRSDVLRLLKHEKISAGTARGFQLSRYELVKLRDWDRCEAYENIVNRHEMFPETLVLPHRPFDEVPAPLSADEVSEVIESVSGYTCRELSDDDAEKAALALYDILVRAFASPRDVYARISSSCIAVMAWNCDRLAMRLLFARLGVEYKGERRAEVFLRQVYQTADGRIKAFFAPPWLKEIKRMCDFEWRE